MIVAVQVVRLPHAEGLPLPAYETAHAARMDLRAAVPEDAPITLQPASWGLAPTSLCIYKPSALSGPHT
jgi:dUTP diphosphatase